MFSQDYIMRLINQAVAALAYALGLKKGGQYQEALQAIDQALEQLLGMRSDLINQLDDRSLLDLVTRRGASDLQRWVIVADLFKEQGEILTAQNRTDESHIAFLRALSVYLEIASQIEPDHAGDLPGKIAGLYQKLREHAIPLDIRLALLNYYENLLAMEEGGLSGSGVSRTKIEETISELGSQFEGFLG